LDSPESKDGSGGEGRVVSGANVEPDMKLDVGLDMDNQDKLINNATGQSAYHICLNIINTIFLR
jgi:hypothetical protein